MNRIEFMTELAALLQDVPEEERRDAMKFYNDYFDDAGEENEQQVIAELENPAKVAATIKEDLGSASREQGEYTEKGFRDSRFENKEMPAGRDYQGRDYQGTGYESYGEQTPPKTNNALKIFLIILLVIFGAPVIIPLAVAVIAVLAACGIALLALFLSLIVASAAVVFAGVCVFIAGVLSLIPEIAVGLALIGTGLILTAIGVVATVASTRLCLIVLPGICRGFIWILRWPFQRRVVA
ncbi:hypothetical protein IMSAGC020_00293 [Lachnospiraceae bacterium]|nr:hypothetical protein IMSAGC020_00293 [Lachnospiraceae bacterium]